MAEGNKAVVRRWFKAFNQGKDAALAALDEILSPDYAMHDPISGEVAGIEALRQFVSGLYDVLPDLQVTLDEVIAEGDRAVYRFRVGGTHTGEFMSYTPTGKRVQGTGICVARIADGRIAEEWQICDLFQQFSSTEAHKELARRLFEEVFNKRDPAAAEQICSKDVVFNAWHWPQLRGLAGIGEFAARMESLDSQYSVDELIAEGDKVDVRWTGKGKHAGEILGLAPTGKVFTVSGVTTLRMAGGKIVEHKGCWDALGVIQQLSVVEANKALARRFIEEVLNGRDWAVADEICAEDVLVHLWHWHDGRGPGAVKEYFTVLESGFPDYHYSIDNLVAEGDRVMVGWTATGTHRGEFMGIPSTGRFGTVEGTMAFLVNRGKVVEISGQFDALRVLQNIGAAPLQAKSESAG